MKKLIAILTLVFTLCTVNLYCPVWAEPAGGQSQSAQKADLDQPATPGKEEKGEQPPQGNNKGNQSEGNVDDIYNSSNKDNNTTENKAPGKNNKVPQAPEEKQPSGLGGILPIAAAALSFIAAVCSVICLIKVFAVANSAKQIIENQNKNIDILGSNFSKAANQICESCGKINSNVNKVWEYLLNTAPSAAAFQQPSQPVEPPRPKTPEEQIDDALTNGVSLEMLGMKPVEITYQGGMYFLQQTSSKLFYRKDSSDGTISIYPGSKISDPAWSNRYGEYFDIIRLGSSGKIHVISPALFYLNTNSGVTELSQKGRVEIN